MEKDKKAKNEERVNKIIDDDFLNGGPVLIVLKAHLLTEYYLEQMIIYNLKRGDILLNEGNFTYYNKLLIVKSLGILKDKDTAALNYLNSLRNKCAHNLKYQIAEADLDRIGAPFGKEYIELKTKFSRDLNVLLKFVIMMICARVIGYISGYIDGDIEGMKNSRTNEKK